MAIPKFAFYMLLFTTLSLRMCSAGTRVHPVPKAFMHDVVAGPSPPIPILSPSEFPGDDEELIASLNSPTPTIDDLTRAIHGLTFVMKDKCDRSFPFIGRDYSQGADLASAMQELTNQIKARASFMATNGNA